MKSYFINILENAIYNALVRYQTHCLENIGEVFEKTTDAMTDCLPTIMKSVEDLIESTSIPVEEEEIPSPNSSPDADENLVNHADESGTDLPF